MSAPSSRGRDGVLLAARSEHEIERQAQAPHVNRLLLVRHVHGDMVDPADPVDPEQGDVRHFILHQRQSGDHAHRPLLAAVAVQVRALGVVGDAEGREVAGEQHALADVGHVEAREMPGVQDAGVAPEKCVAVFSAACGCNKHLERAPLRLCPCRLE